MTKKSTTIYMEDCQYEHVKKLSMKTGIPMAVIVRRGIDMVIAELEQREEREEQWLATQQL